MSDDRLDSLTYSAATLTFDGVEIPFERVEFREMREELSTFSTKLGAVSGSLTMAADATSKLFAALEDMRRHFTPWDVQMRKQLERRACYGNRKGRSAIRRMLRHARENLVDVTIDGVTYGRVALTVTADPALSSARAPDDAPSSRAPNDSAPPHEKRHEK